MQMNRDTVRIGYFSALAITFIITMYLIVFAVRVIIPPEREWKNLRENYDDINDSGAGITTPSRPGFSVFYSLALASVVLLLFACFHDCVDSTLKIYSCVSLCFIIVYTVIITAVCFAEFEVSRFFIPPGREGCLKFLSRYYFPHLLYSVSMLTSIIFPGLSALFIIPVFSKAEKIEKQIRIGLPVFGISSLLSALMFVLNELEIFNYFMVSRFLSLIVLMILSMKFFRYSADRSQEE